MRTVGLVVKPEPASVDETALAEYDIGNKTVHQLRQLAADIGIEVGKGAKKDDIINAIIAAGGEA